MSVFQLLVNILIAVVAVAILSFIFNQPEVAFPLEGLVWLGLAIVAVILTFSHNAAARLGIN